VKGGTQPIDAEFHTASWASAPPPPRPGRRRGRHPSSRVRSCRPRAARSRSRSLVLSPTCAVSTHRWHEVRKRSQLGDCVVRPDNASASAANALLRKRSQMPFCPFPGATPARASNPASLKGSAEMLGTRANHSERPNSALQAGSGGVPPSAARQARSFTGSPSPRQRPVPLVH
jgi:hypothetical protein